MAIQDINLGSYANDGTGDDLRTAFEKVINNFSYLDEIKVEDGANLGAGAPVFATKTPKTLNFRSIAQGSNIFIDYTDTTITINTPDSINAVEEDPAPKLGGNLDLNGYEIFNANGSVFEPALINAISISGSSYDTPDTVTIGTRFVKDDLLVFSDGVLTLTSDMNQVNINGDVDQLGNFTNHGITTLTGNGDLEVTLAVKGGETGDQFTVTTHGVPDDGIILSSQNADRSDLSSLTLTGTVVNVASDLNVTGMITGNVTASDIIVTNGITVDNHVLVYGPVTALSFIGDLTGNVTGQISDISNHTLYELSNVNVTSPVAGQVLKYDGTKWVNGTDATGGGGGGGDLDFGSFTSPSGFSLDLGSF